MKKFNFIIAALIVSLVLAPVAMAGYPTRTSLTSPGITGSEDACEKYGAATIVLENGTKVRDGDWMFFDLPLGVQLCKSFDFVVLGDGTADNDPTTQNVGPQPNGGVVAGAWVTNMASADNTTDDYGPWEIEDLGAVAGATGIAVTPGGAATGIFLRVTGSSGQNRVWYRFYDNNSDIISAPSNANGDSLLTVMDDVEFKVSLFDGEPWDATTSVKNPTAFIWAYNDTDNDGQYGEAIANGDLLQTNNDWDNFICAEYVNYSMNEVNVSFDSGGRSGDDFLTFSGQREIAHRVNAETYTLGACGKQDLYGFVDLSSAQGNVCTFDYETATNYCADVGNADFVTGGGNRILIQKTSGNFDDDDMFRVYTRVTTGDGTYYGGAPALGGVLATEANDPCTVAFATTAIGETWTPFTRSGATFTSYATGTDCTALAAGQQVDEMRTTAWAFPSDLYNRLVVMLPTMIYYPGVLADLDMATVEIELWQLPCGKIFDATRDIAQYVDACPTAAPTTTLLFPYAVPMTDANWWYGFSFCNPSNTAGTALVTVFEDDGDMGTYTTDSVAAGDMVTMTGAQLLALLSPDAANVGTLGDARFHMTVDCNFGGAGGFGMMGNNLDSTGYVPYGNSAMWNY